MLFRSYTLFYLLINYYSFKNIESTNKNIKNIDEAIQIAHPQFIDISSGIEEIKGIKSSKLIIEILQKIKIYNQKNSTS